MTNFQEKWKSYVVWDDNNIKGFFGENEYRFLSNFHPARVYFDGLSFPTSEHAYQAAKAEDLTDRIPFTCKFGNMTAAQSKKEGRSLKIRKDWEDVKYDIMAAIVFDKFYRNLDLRAKLLETGQKYLEELNHWNDFTWGVCNGKGKNWLGKILMNTRDYFRKHSTNIWLPLPLEDRR